ncbi:hypothetical protein D3C85_322440 [compost metagenome]
MKLQINQNEKRFVIVENETISGVLITIDTTHDLSTVLTALSLNDISIHSTLDGKKTEAIVPKMSMLELHALVFANNKPLSLKTFQDSKGFGINNCYQLPFDFKTPLNLKNGEGLFIESDCKMLSGGTTTAISIETIPTIGVKVHQPKYEVLELEATKSVHDIVLDNNVSRVVYMGNGNAGAPYDVEEVSIKSDKLNADLTDSLIYSQLLDTAEPDTDYSGSPIHLVSSNQVLHDVRLKIKFANAIAGRKLIIERKITDPKTLTNLMQKNQEHQQENLQAIKANASK